MVCFSIRTLSMLRWEQLTSSRTSYSCILAKHNSVPWLNAWVFSTAIDCQTIVNVYYNWMNCFRYLKEINQQILLLCKRLLLSISEHWLVCECMEIKVRVLLLMYLLMNSPVWAQDIYSRSYMEHQLIWSVGVCSVCTTDSVIYLDLRNSCDSYYNYNI